MSFKVMYVNYGQYHFYSNCKHSAFLNPSITICLLYNILYTYLQ